MYRGVYLLSELSANRAGAAHDEIVHPSKAESNLVPRAFVTLDQRNGRGTSVWERDCLARKSFQFGSTDALRWPFWTDVEVRQNSTVSHNSDKSLHL